MVRPVFALGLALSMIYVRADAVRVDDGAFGDWRSDAPGVERHITPALLPPPYDSPSSARSPSIVRRPAGASPRVPDGFQAEQVAGGLEQPRTLRTAPNGDVFLAESGGGRILVLRDGAKPAVFASGLDLPYGIAFWPPGPSPRFVYVAEQNRVTRYPYRAGQTAPSGPSEVIVPDLPEGGNHWTRDLAFSLDGQTLFVSVGSTDNVARSMRGAPSPGAAMGAAWGENTNRADVLTFTPEGGPPHAYATGLRNCSGEVIQPSTGALWCVVNERDGLGDNLPPDYVTEVKRGAFYGWPWFYIGNHPDPRHKGERADLADKVTVPDVLIQPHSAPLGIAFYAGDQFPAEYKGDAFVTLHGSWNRAKRTGYKMVRVRFQNGRPTGAYEDFMTGFVVSDDSVWGRPVGVTVTKDGALLVSEDGNGTVWRISHR